MTGVTGYFGRSAALSRTRLSLALLVSMFIAVLAFGVQAAYAMDNAVCTSCHAATVDMDVAPVDRDVACKKCHLEFAGVHPYHQAGANCAAACHPQWGDSLLTATPRYTDPVSRAGFASSASKSTPAEELHIIHSSARWPAGVSATSSACASCHAAAACTACHTGAIPAVHAEHSSSANGAWSGVMGYGVIGGDQTQRSAFADTNQCATSGCHDLATTRAARPRMVEDYNHAVGGNPDDPGVASDAITSVGTWRVRANTLYSGSRMSYNNVAGSTFTAAFTGGRVELVSDRDPYRGRAEVLIDGAVVGTIDCYAPATQIQAVVFARDVAQGAHTITVRPTGAKDSAARGAFVVIDAFNVYPASRGSVAPECSSCHASQAADHGARDAHAGGDLGSAWCASCHGQTNLMTLHEAQTDAEGAPLGCIICHGTTDATVKAAVLAGDKRCTTCHTPHAAQHVNTWTTCAGVGCHNGGDLVTVHAPVGCGCHDSVDATVVAALAAGDKDCTACHNPMLQHGSVHDASATYAAPVEFPGSNGMGGGTFVIKCLSCHRTNLLSNHGSDYSNCSMCHLAGGPRASFTSWNKNCQAGACHPGPTAPHPPTHSLHYHNRMSIGIQPEGMCQSCHGGPENMQCGAAFGCHAGAVPPVTSVDFKVPVTTVTQIASEPITWQLLATDVGDGVVATYYSWDDGPFVPYTAADHASGIVNPADAQPPYAHTLRYYSVDAAGNTEPIQTKVYDVSDNTPPVVTFNGIGGASVAKSIQMLAVDPKVNGLRSGVAFIHVEVRAYNPYWGSYSIQQWWPLADYSYALDGTAESTRTVGDLQARAWAMNSGNYYTYKDYGGGNGRFQIQYYARDYAGNQSAMTYADVWIDNSGPVTSAAKVSGVWRWKLTSYDSYGSSVDKTYYRFDGGAWTEYTAADATNGVGHPSGDVPGPHTMDYYSTDTLGNVEAVKTVSYTVP